MEKTTVHSKLLAIQTELKAPKGQKNTFGNYSYRSCEDILEAVKPLLKKHKCTLILKDDIVAVGSNDPLLHKAKEYKEEWVNKQKTTKAYDIEAISGEQRFYVKAIAVLSDPDGQAENIEVTAFAREAETKKGMDYAQITGSASSYARKYALNGLFAIDDAKDADTNEQHNQTNRPAGKTTPPPPPKTITLVQKKDIKELAEVLGVEIKKIEDANKKSLDNFTFVEADKVVKQLKAKKKKAAETGEKGMSAEEVAKATGGEVIS